MAILYRDPNASPRPAEYIVQRIVGPAAHPLERDDNRWQEARVIGWGPTRYLTTFRALWDVDALHARFDCRDDRPWHTMTGRDDPIWNEEVVEIFLDPATSGREYAEVEISPANVICDLRVEQPWPHLRGNRAWDWEGLETFVFARENETEQSWGVSLRMPWSGLRTLSDPASRSIPPRAGDRWRFNVFRVKRPGGPSAPEQSAIYAAWSTPDGPSFHVPSFFRDLVFR